MCSESQPELLFQTSPSLAFVHPCYNKTQLPTADLHYIVLPFCNYLQDALFLHCLLHTPFKAYLKTTFSKICCNFHNWSPFGIFHFHYFSFVVETHRDLDWKLALQNSFECFNPYLILLRSVSFFSSKGK